jgi:molecular chaperone GrpE
VTEADAGGGETPIDGDGGPRPAPDAGPAPEASPDDGAGPAPDQAGEGGAGPHDDEVILEDIAGLEATVETERDEYLERLQRLQAEFENYRRRMTREQAEAGERGAQSLALELLPVLDGCEAALQQGRDDVEPIHAQLMELLTKAGLERNGEPGDPFDPERHEAVVHEPAQEGEDAGSAIAEVLRTGYSWKGRVLRPAMVKVRG